MTCRICVHGLQYSSVASLPKTLDICTKNIFTKNWHREQIKVQLEIMFWAAIGLFVSLLIILCDCTNWQEFQANKYTKEAFELNPDYTTILCSEVI